MAGHLVGRRLAFVGDIHSFGTSSGYQDVCVDYIQYNGLLDALFILGDVTYDSVDTEYDNVKTWMDKWATETYPIIGNHDLKNKYLADETERTFYKDLFKTKLGVSATNYIVTYGNCVFILISTDGHLSTDAAPKFPGEGVMTTDTLNFLTAALAANQNKNVFVCSHQVPYDITQWATERDGNKYYNAAAIQALLTTYRVDVWLYAHCHQSYKGGVVDISEPYTGVPPEFRNTTITALSPRSAAPANVVNGANSTLFVPCWGGNKFYGSRVRESRYIELVPDATSITVLARDHTNGIWQTYVDQLSVTKTLPYAIAL